MKRSYLPYVVFFLGAAVLVCFLVTLYVPRKNISTVPPPTLSNEEYKVVYDGLVARMNANDPRASIDSLKPMTESDPRTARVCHELLHELGRAALVKYDNDFARAMSFRDDFCVSGYIHGVIEQYFKTATDTDVAMRDLCVAYPARSFLEWECYHGIGHGLMFASHNDVPASLRRCQNFGDERLAAACANGVYMENFNADGRLHTSSFVRPDNPFYPCDTEVPFKQDCYMGAAIYYLTLHHDDYTSALAWCMGAGEWKASCAYGVGAQAARRSVSDEGRLAHSCDGAPFALRTSCVNGVGAGLVSHYQDRARAQRVCAAMSIPDRLVCSAAVRDALL